MLPLATTEQAQGLGERMKSYEAVYDISLPEGKPAILRLDGHSFSKFTSKFVKPFDPRIHDAMVETCKSLMQECYPSATVAYTFSDEISLVFPHGICDFNNRIQKIVSLAASTASVQFNLHLARAIEQGEASGLEPVKGTPGNAYFDGRLFTVPHIEEALNCLIWRCKMDAVRNSVHGVARSMYSTEELHGKKTGEMIQMMQEEKGVSYKDSVPSWALSGTLVKRELVLVEGVNGKTGEKVTAMRTRISARDGGVMEFSDENLRLITEKYWNEI